MEVQCPACGATISLDALFAHEGARDAMMAVFAISGPLGMALPGYLALFRPAARRKLTMDRTAKLLRELLPDLQARRIRRDGQEFPAPMEAWLYAIEKTLQARDAGKLTLPLTSHGWLCEVIKQWRPSAETAASPPSGTPKIEPTKTGVVATLDQLDRLHERRRT